MTFASVLLPIAGGLLIGLAAIGLLLFNGRVAGVSGIVGSLLGRLGADAWWKIAFVVGLLFGGLVLRLFAPQVFASDLSRSLPTLAIAGLLVGFGARLGSGCTSGHGVCGLARLSPRSLVATATFTAAGAAIVLISQHVFGGQL